MDVSVTFCTGAVANLLKPAFAAVSIVLFGPPFNSEPFHETTLPADKALLQTTQFVMICDSMEFASSGSGHMTCSGHYGLLRPFFDGYSRGEHGCDTWGFPDGSTRNVGALGLFQHDYDPHLGIAKLNFYGREFTIEKEARILRIKGQVFALPKTKAEESPNGVPHEGIKLWEIPKGRTVILVDSKGKARAGRQEDVDQARKLADQAFAPAPKDPQVNARPRSVGAPTKHKLAKLRLKPKPVFFTTR